MHHEHAGDPVEPWNPPPYPRSGPEHAQTGAPTSTWWTVFVVGTAVVAVLAAAAAAVALNPMADEWVCAPGEAPAYVTGPVDGAQSNSGGGCLPLGEPLPENVAWDPLGNRPMPYNCDKEGWTRIENDQRDEAECLKDGLPTPAGWH